MAENGPGSISGDTATDPKRKRGKAEPSLAHRVKVSAGLSAKRTIQRVRALEPGPHGPGVSSKKAVAQKWRPAIFPAPGRQKGRAT